MKTIKVDPIKCTGCHLCELACSFKHYDVYKHEFARIRVYTDEAFAKDVHTTCKQCEDAPCIAACPVDALSKDENTDAIIVDHDTCILCGQCVEACPYDAIKDIKVEGKELINVCNLCDGDPECVKYCYDHAITYEEK